MWTWEKNPEQDGWYLICYCWDMQEGTFYDVDFFRFYEGWENREDYPIQGYDGPFDSEEVARIELEKRCLW